MRYNFTNAALLPKRGFFKLIMRVFVFLCCTLSFGFNTESVLSQDAQILINSYRTVTVRQVFELIKTQTDYKFIYRNDLLEHVAPVDLKKGTFRVRELLDKCLLPANFTYNFRANNTIVVKRNTKKALNEAVSPVIDKIEVTGVVVDENGEPLPGASVRIKGTSMGTITDVDGRFKLSVEEDATLIFSFIGYQSAEIAVNSRKVIEVQLFSDLRTLQEVVVVGFGTTVKEDLTGSVGTIKAKELGQIQTQTIDQALVGHIPGVFVNAGGGAPGTGAIVNVRGLSALQGDNQPLYIVDGVPIIQFERTGNDGLVRANNRENPLLSINPADVERIDVLKDASSAAIYGSRAANGVIIITTKRGRRNQAPRFNLSVRSTIQNPTNRLDLLDVGEFRELLEQQEIDVSDFGTADTDWQDLISNKNALWNQADLSVSGGTGKTSYYASLSASDQEGILIGNEFQRYGFSTNLDIEASERLKIGTSINYNYSVNKQSGITSFNNALYRPDQPVFNEDGSFTSVPGFFGDMRNPLGDEAMIRDRAVSQNVIASAFGEYRIIDGLKFKTQLSANLNNDKSSRFSPSYTFVALLGLDGFQGAILDNNTTENVTTAFINTLSYKKILAQDHAVDFLAGVSWNRSKLELERQVYVGFPDDETLTDINSASNFVRGESEAVETGLNSYFGRLNYGYREKYLLTFTARSDESTRFGPNNRRGFFPSGAIAWNIHKEGFLAGTKPLSQLKLRASLGRTGSDNLPDFSYIPTFRTLNRNGSFYDGVNGIVSDDVPNNDIRWEQTDQLDIGLEFGLFENRFNAEINYFNYKTSDLILLVPIPFETGSTRFNSNIADVSNKGWEIMLGGDVIRTDKVNWYSSFNVSFVRNNVDALNGGSVLADGRSVGIEEGQPIGVIFGLEIASIAQTQEEIDALNAASPNGVYDSFLSEPGDYIFRDLNGDGEITADDRTTLGDITPDYFGGWNNTVTYKNFDASFNFQFVEGVEREWTRPSSLFGFDGEENITTLVFDTWSEENTGANYARIGSLTHVIDVNSRNVQDASYIRLRSASIGYRLPRGLTEKIGIRNAKLTISGNNLFTITDFPDQDPENIQPFTGNTTDTIREVGVSYPQARTFTIGLNVGF